MISTSHPLVSITVTRAPAARPSASPASLFTRCCVDATLCPLPLVTLPDQPRRRRRNDSKKPESHRDIPDAKVDSFGFTIITHTVTRAARSGISQGSLRDSACSPADAREPRVDLVLAELSAALRVIRPNFDLLGSSEPVEVERRKLPRSAVYTV